MAATEHMYLKSKLLQGGEKGEFEATLNSVSSGGRAAGLAVSPTAVLLGFTLEKILKNALLVDGVRGQSEQGELVGGR